jgi:hypothetical protein
LMPLIFRRPISDWLRFHYHFIFISAIADTSIRRRHCRRWASMTDWQ